MSGRILVLNGTSSSGKTTLAKCLQRRLTEPHLLLSVDDFLGAMMPPQAFTAPVPAAEFSRWLNGFHAAVAAIAREGNRIILDHVLTPVLMQDFLRRLDGISVVFIGIRCPLAEVERRERERGDRRSGLAASQFPTVHAGAAYDLDVDTSTTSAEGCADAIVAFLRSDRSDTAQRERGSR